MTSWYIKVIIYLFSFVISLYGLSALDFNRAIKKGKVASGQVLYIVLAMALSYLVGNLIINLIYTLN